MSTSEDEFEQDGGDYMDIEQESNENEDQEFGEDLPNGNFGDHISAQKPNGKRKLARPMPGRKYYTEEEGDKMVRKNPYMA